MAKFTPGPWAKSAQKTAISGEPMSWSVDGPLGDYMYLQNEADAALIASAPDLYAALVGLVAVEDSVTQCQERELRKEWLPKARAAIVKAEAA